MNWSETLLKFPREQIELYATNDPTCIYDPWPLRQGRGKYGEFPVVVLRKHYIDQGYKVLASEPRLPHGEGFIVVSYPGKRRRRDPAYLRMAELFGLEALDSLNALCDKAKLEASESLGGGDPDLFVYKPQTSERFFVEVKHKDFITPKQRAVFPLLHEQLCEVKIMRVFAD